MNSADGQSGWREPIFASAIRAAVFSRINEIHKMSKQSAIGVLIGFAVAAAAVAFWGFSDIFKWLRAMSDCRNRIEIDTSSFWFIGIASLAGLPFFALFQAPRVQKVLLVALVLWFIAVPIAVHQYFVGEADVHGYSFPPEYSLFKLERAVVRNSFCTPERT